MSDDVRPGMRPDTAEWLASGPDRAPAGLLARALDQSRATRQRPAMLAVALGAPIVTGRSSAITPLRVWLVIALLVAAAASIAIAAGWPDRTELVVVTSPDPSATAAPLPSATPVIPSTFTAGYGLTVERSALNAWADAHPVVPYAGIFVGHRWEFEYDVCGDTTCASPHTIELTAGPVQDGIIYASRPCPPSAAGNATTCAIWNAENRGDEILAITGSSTEELVAAWVAHFGDGTRTNVTANDAVWTVIEYETRVVALLVIRGTAVEVSLNDYRDMAPHANVADVERFLGAVHFQPAATTTPPITERFGDVELAMPGGWLGYRSGSTLTLSNGDLLAFRETVRRVAPGDSLVIVRIDATPGRRTFTVSGTTLDELAASIDAGMPDAARRDITIGSVRAVRWSVPQASYVGPLAGVIAFEWKGAFYVIQEHFPLDAAFAGYLDLVLQGLTLL